MTNYYIPIIYIVPLISVDGQASLRLFIAPEIRHEKNLLFYMIYSLIIVSRKPEQAGYQIHFSMLYIVCIYVCIWYVTL